MDDAAALLAQLQQLLRHESLQGRKVALIIDEAQELPLETLEQLPLLANLTPSGSLPPDCADRPARLCCRTCGAGDSAAWRSASVSAPRSCP